MTRMTAGLRGLINSHTQTPFRQGPTLISFSECRMYNGEKNSTLTGKYMMRPAGGNKKNVQTFWKSARGTEAIVESKILCVKSAGGLER